MNTGGYPRACPTRSTSITSECSATPTGAPPPSTPCTPIPASLPGVNLDGNLWTPQGQAGSGRPLLLFGKQDLDPCQASTWAAFWPNQRGPKLWLNLAGATHPSFEDFAILLPQAAPILGVPSEEVTAVVGPIGGLRAAAVLRTYLNAYFDRYLRHRNSALLDGPLARYPEVQFTR